MDDEKIAFLKERLRRAKKLMVLTGAGISAESGVPTFRGQDGLWQNYNVTDLATPQAFAANPKLVWAFYNWRRNLISQIKENPAHQALAILEESLPDFTLVTQNVDGLHRRAGSKNIIEIHGNLWQVKCSQCRQKYIDMSVNMGTLPLCKICGGLLRPDVVWFGENLDHQLLQRVEETAQTCDVLLVIGTSCQVYPVAAIPMIAKNGGAFAGEINTEETPITAGIDITIIGKAGEILPLLVK
jgi:NAD-dependent deacetylase